MALAHSVDDKVEAAYRRADMFEKGGSWQKAWARYCVPGESSGDVVPIRAEK